MKEKDAPFDVIGFLLKHEDIKEYLPEALNLIFNILPDNFPKDIGVLYYNQQFHSLVDKYGNELSQKGKKATLEFLKISHSVLKKTIDRAIQKTKPEEDDRQILKEFFSPEPNFDWKEEKGSYLPWVFFKNIWVNLFVKWIFYVWKGNIKIKRCEAENCNKIFIPNPRGPEQKYCSTRCRDRETKRRYRQRKKELSRV